MALHAVSSPVDALERFKAGEITLDQYLDEKVERALDHIRKLVPSERLEMLRDVLREHIRTDPVTLELIRQVTGVSIDPTTDDVKH